MFDIGLPRDRKDSIAAILVKLRTSIREDGYFPADVVENHFVPFVYDYFGCGGATRGRVGLTAYCHGGCAYGRTGALSTIPNAARNFRRVSR